jgi:phage tail sheath protein FI
MPEYLSPGVYVEEIDTGNKPIEGVSTSTAGMVGLAERGPVNVPILVTAYGEYMRWFGGYLNIEDFSNATGAHCYLPHAVEGFFTNQGKRAFITRVVPDGAVAATDQLFDRGSSASPETIILRAAAESTGTTANPPLLYVLDPTGMSAVAPGNWIRIGDGSPAEYKQVAAIGAVASNTHVPLNLPLNFLHDAISDIQQFTPAFDAVNYTAGFTLAAAADAGATTISVTGAAADLTKLQGSPKQILEIGGTLGEHHFAVSATVTGSTASVALEAPLVMAFAAAATVSPLKTPAIAPTAHLALDANTGDSLVFVDNRAGGLNTVTDLVYIEATDPTHYEVRRIGVLAVVDISPNTYEEYPIDSMVNGVTLANDDRSLTAFAAGPPPTLTLSDISCLSPGGTLWIDTGVNQESATIATIVTPNQVTITAALTKAHVLPVPVTPDFSLKTLTSDAPAGSRVVALGNRISLNIDDVVRIGTAPNQEYATIVGLPNRAPAGISPDAGNVVLDHPLDLDHPSGDTFRRQTPPTPTALATNVLPLDADQGSSSLLTTDGTGYAANQFLRVTIPDGEAFYHLITGVAAAAPVEVTLATALERAHPAGSPVVGRSPLIQVQALDVGEWGNRLRVSVQDEAPGLVSRTTIATIINPTHIRLASAAGVEAGTILELPDPLNNNAVVAPPLKVVSVDRTSNNTITLQSALSGAQITAQANAVLAGQALGVRSREFRVTVYLLHQADPALPSRDTVVIDTEVFRNLSMDPRHSHYIQTIIGDIDGRLRLEDRRPEGQSWYIRVHDLGQDVLPDPTATLESIRLGPEALVDILPSGSEQAAQQALEGGDDSVNTVDDDTYIGQDNVDPEQRTGLFSLVNIEEVSIIAVPGQTTAAVQQALIDQCEAQLYRFAVLDGPPPPDDSIADVQNLRQQFDTKYAALYHPWLLIEDPFPTNLQQIANFPIPPSGSVMGVYARTDDDRGVHKAPANEVVNGIIGLQRTLYKGEQDILNPFPVNINVIRDFRKDNRSIRIWGARVITSDPDWIYVNVRRLMIFLEQSLNIGLQWVVFEPNAEPLWARVKRTITNFLTTVWRNGALEGTKPEEAFFVKCDSTTMTQDDIDNGRLIVVIGVAPVRPAEFVIIRIGLWTAGSQT